MLGASQGEVVGYIVGPDGATVPIFKRASSCLKRMRQPSSSPFCSDASSVSDEADARSPCHGAFSSVSVLKLRASERQGWHTEVVNDTFRPRCAKMTIFESDMMT